MAAGKGGVRQAKLLIGDQASKTLLVEVMKLERRWLRLTKDWLTRPEWRVNYHLSKLGLNWTMDCRWCHVEEETTEHLLSGCLAWAELRQKLLGSPHLEAGKLRELDLDGLVLPAERINRRLA